jgi:peptide/nickel transport system substrate-binding protein
MNNTPDVGGPFSNPKVQQAVRYALDYDGIMTLAGSGAVRLAGIIPTNFPGALDPATAVKMDQAKAKSLLKEANLGDVKGALSYRSDSTLFGIQTPLLAQKVQGDLAAVGIQVTLDGQPLSTALQKYRDGKDQVGLWGWATDYADEADFLVYLPGRTVGKRAGWAADASPEAQDLVKLGQQAEVEVDDAKRVALYKQVDQRIAEIGPYAPLFQPAIPYAFRSNVQGVTYNTVWAVDLYPIGKSG